MEYGEIAFYEIQMERNYLYTKSNTNEDKVANTKTITNNVKDESEINCFSKNPFWQ